MQLGAEKFGAGTEDIAGRGTCCHRKRLCADEQGEQMVMGREGLECGAVGQQGQYAQHEQEGDSKILHNGKFLPQWGGFSCANRHPNTGYKATKRNHSENPTKGRWHLRWPGGQRVLFLSVAASTATGLTG